MQRIFLVGCPRSGTTLVQSLLASAPGMVTFTESHFFDKCFRSRFKPLRRDVYDRECVESTIERFNRENDLRDDRFDDDAWKSASSLARAFIHKLDRVSSGNNGTGWVEKTPDHLRRIRLIQSVAPDAMFVHVLRNPAETIASLRMASMEWGRPRSWLAFAAKWSICVVASARDMGKVGHAHIFYEDIIDDSRQASMRLFDELGLAWDEGVLERYLVTAKTVIAADETWKQNNLREIRRKDKGDIEHNVLQKFLLKFLNHLYREIRSNA